MLCIEELLLRSRAEYSPILSLRGQCSWEMSEPLYGGIKKGEGKIPPLSRSRAESNRCMRFCRPPPSHSATEPFLQEGKSIKKNLFYIKNSWFCLHKTFFAKPRFFQSKAKPILGIHPHEKMGFNFPRIEYLAPRLALGLNIENGVCKISPKKAITL